MILIHLFARVAAVNRTSTPNIDTSETSGGSSSIRGSRRAARKTGPAKGSQ